jgi:predicted SAM-dependent methyltransferase
MTVETSEPALPAGKPLASRLRDFLAWRSRPLRGWLRHSLEPRGLRLRRLRHLRTVHVGCGLVHLDGWINVDLQKLPEGDVAFDVTRRFPFRDLTHVYAEHFLEHLRAADALEFLVAVRRALAPQGRLRLSTPNLDWVLTHVYRARVPGEDADARVARALAVNRAFYGWGHRFLWNRETLTAALAAAGFTDARWCRYGESDEPAFAGLERHETGPDEESLPHVLIVEAMAGDPTAPGALRDLAARIEREVGRYLED